ncbi:MAG: 4-hydroxy-3-methylbut-2-enyl diphosphate reductase [Verrucomicrobiales bacterium]
MKITLARHFGMCFGVRDALRKTHELSLGGPVTVLGQLVHNPVVSAHLESLGVRSGALEDVAEATTRDVVITAHGAADGQRAAWRNAGFRVTDTTCPLVRKAHAALQALIAADFSPIVIGKKGHVEVRGLTGDFPQTVVIETEEDIESLPYHHRIGVISQTTQPIKRVQYFVSQIQRRHPASEVRFVDTVCQPTKDRQAALEELCRESEVVIVVGGRNSNNTAELVAGAEKLGVRAYHVVGPGDVKAEWFGGVARVGVTAGTSTLEESVDQVVRQVQELAAGQRT